MGPLNLLSQIPKLIPQSLIDLFMAHVALLPSTFKTVTVSSAATPTDELLHANEDRDYLRVEVQNQTEPPTDPVYIRKQGAGETLGLLLQQYESRAFILKRGDRLFAVRDSTITHTVMVMVQ